MRTRPPYLFSGSRDTVQSSYLELTGDVDTATIEVAVHGRFTRQLCRDIVTTLDKCVAAYPSAIIADLHDFGDPDGASVPLWLSQRESAAELAPPVQLVLCVPTATMVSHRLRRVGLHRHLPTYATMPEARAAVRGGAPPSDVLQLRLPPEGASASRARDLVAEACATWDLPYLLHPASLIISELVSNAAEHAGTNMLVTVSRRGAGLHLSVRDGDPRPPQFLDPPPALDEPGHGLRVVHAYAAAWGSMPARIGKVVWATVRQRRRRR